MRRERDWCEETAEDVRQHVFAMLEAEPEIDGATAGDVAARVEAAYLAALAVHGFEVPHKAWPQVDDDSDTRVEVVPGWTVEEILQREG